MIRLLLCFFIGLSAALLPPRLAAAPLQVTVSVLPIATFVRAVGGPHVTVSSLVKPGADPHSFEPSPQQIAALSDSALYFLGGMPFERVWLPRFRAANPRMKIVDLPATVVSHDAPPSPVAPHDHASDPHVWTDPLLAREMVLEICAELSTLDPAHRQDYEQSAQAYAARLLQLHADIERTLAKLRNRAFIAFHPAWGYFAQRYHLTQIPVEHEGKDPGPRSLAQLIDRARNQGIKTVLVQPQFSERMVQVIASAIDGRIVAADPLAPDYIDNLRRLAGKLAEPTP